MWVRAVGVAIAVVAGCWAATVPAAQYTEVWNPPEARHAPRHAKAVKAVSHAKGKQRTMAAKKGAGHVKMKAKSGSRLAQKSVGKTTAKTASMSSRKTHLKTAASTATNRNIKTARLQGARTLTTAKPVSAQMALTMDGTSSRASTQPASQMANQANPR